MKLLVQADDYGFTRGVTMGILDAIQNGFLRNTGMFTNMPEAEYAASFIRNHPMACFGVDFNLVSGPSVADPKTIPHLVDENGDFIRSNIRIKDPRWQTEEGRLEMFPQQEVTLELEAQFQKFISLTGKKPGYVHTHSLRPESYLRAIREISQRENIPFSWDVREKYGFFGPLTAAIQEGAGQKKEFDPLFQINKNPEGLFWAAREEMLAHEYVNIGGHCGFVDAALFDLTSLSIERARDHQMVTSKRILDWIKGNDVQLITYYDLA
ncbi:ChbG/HpnK family deacetylase [Eubacteriales bacterium OttesenSCG-928-M02]|nr:ChbG/HpnK family deacetylase [Eubacteriales bacterium OttesenSCG-928-M02]